MDSNTIEHYFWGVLALIAYVAYLIDKKLDNIREELQELRDELNDD